MAVNNTNYVVGPRVPAHPPVFQKVDVAEDLSELEKSAQKVDQHIQRLRSEADKAWAEVKDYITDFYFIGVILLFPFWIYEAYHAWSCERDIKAINEGNLDLVDPNLAIWKNFKTDAGRVTYTIKGEIFCLGTDYKKIAASVKKRFSKMEDYLFALNQLHQRFHGHSADAFGSKHLNGNSMGITGDLRYSLGDDGVVRVAYEWFNTTNPDNIWSYNTFAYIKERKVVLIKTERAMTESDKERIEPFLQKIAEAENSGFCLPKLAGPAQLGSKS